MRPRAVAAISLLVLFLVVPPPAASHALLRRYDLPLPLGHYLIGAGLAVTLTFLLLAFFRASRPGLFSTKLDLSRTIFARSATIPWLRRGLNIVSLSSFAFLIAAGFVGVQEEPLKNILPTFIWVGWWVGFAFFCALIANAWPAVNPWAIVGRAVERAARRRPPRPLPPGIGVWPGAVFFFVFAWAELVWPDNVVPAKLAGVILLYSAVTWLAMARYGTEPWLRAGETFSLLFDLFGRFAPLGRERDGRWALRPYGAGLLGDGKLATSMVVLVVTLLSTVSFDGFLHTPPWRKLFGAAFQASYDLGLIHLLGNTGARTLIVTAGLIAAPVIFLTVFGAVCAWTAALMGNTRSGRSRALDVAKLYALTLVPIAIAYHLAHYLSLLLIEGQRFLALVSDPFGWGWNLFGTAGIVPDIAVVDARFLWLFSVGVIVAGHIIAVALAHTIALQVCDDRKKALVSQVPMLVLMIGYTMLSLWILAQPIVEA